MSLREVIRRAGSSLAGRWWVFAIYSIPFATPVVFRAAKKLAAALGCMPSLSVALSYLMLLLVGVIAVWLLATRWRRIATIAPLERPYGLPAMSVDPFVALLAVAAILLVPPLIGSFGQDGAVFATSVGVGYRVVTGLGRSQSPRSWRRSATVGFRTGACDIGMV